MPDHGVVHQNVDAAEPAADPLDQRFDLGRLAQIGALEDDLDAVLLASASAAARPFSASARSCSATVAPAFASAAAMA
jgi:hypothetical protein